MSDPNVMHPTLLMVGQGEPMDAALRVALDRHGIRVEESKADVKASVRMTAPDAVLLVGSAALDGGRAILDLLAIDPVTNVVPVIVLGHAEKLDSRVTAFRSGAVAVVPRTASADQIAMRVAEVTRELGERGESQQDTLGEATFDELVSLVAQELRSGILSVGRANNAGDPMRIVLGAGRPVADAVEEFVRKLRPLVSRAEPLVYELHASTGGPVGLLDPEPGGRGDLSLLKGLRVILVDADASRVDTLAQQLRGHGATVAVADPSARGLERARNLDPEVVIVDAAGIEGPGFEVVRAIRGDVRLRWATMMVAPWADIWPESAQSPDLAELVERIRPLVVHDQALRERAAKEPSFDTRLEATGPSRLLRVLASLAGPFHVSLRNRKASVEVDVAEGLVVGARATRAAGDVIEGTRALAAMLAMASSRVHIEKRTNPSLANLMAPVEEALAQASAEAAPIPLSAPPPAPDGPSRALRKPFPTASEVGRGVFDEDKEPSGPLRAPLPRPRPPTKAEATSRDLKWSDSETGDRPSSTGAAPTGLFSGGASAAPKPRDAAPRPRAALSAFGESKPLFPPIGEAKPESDDPTRIYPSEELARAAQAPMPPQPPAPRRASAPPDPGTLKAKNASRAPASPPLQTSRKPTLVMGGSTAPEARAPTSRPPLGAPFVARSTTLTMGAAPPSAPPPSGTTDLSSSDLSSSDLETLAGDLGRDEGSSVFGDRTDPASGYADRTDPSVPAFKTESPGAPPLPPSAIIQPTTRARVATPSFESPPKPVGETLAAPTLPLAAATPARSPTSAPPDPTPLGVISAPAPPSGVPSKPTSFAPAPEPVPPSPAVPGPAAPARSAGRGLAWLLVALGATALAGVAAWIGWTRYGPLLLGANGIDPIAVPLAAADAAVAVDAAAVVDASLAIDAAEVASDAGVALVPVPTAEPVDSGIDAAEPEVVAPEPTPPEPTPTVDVSEGGSAEELVARAEGLPDAQAEGLYRRAVALDPRNHYAMLGLAGILMRRGAAAEAIPFIEGAIRRRGRRAEYRVMLGDARRDAGDADGARAAWREALEIDPDDATAHARLGE